MQKLATDFVTALKPKSDAATVVGLYGDLGAGKTTFTQGVALALGLEENIVSPTFVIEKIYSLSTIHYPLFNNLIHIDAYRIEQSSELLNLGWQKIISDPGNLILIEWPERVSGIMPLHVRINFSHLSENEREVEIE